MTNKMLESVDTVHTIQFYGNNKKGKNNCIYKRYI